MNDDINNKFDENHIISERRQKLDNIRKQRSAYPNSFMPKNIVKYIIQDYLAIERDKLLELGAMVSIAGRIMLKRVMGRASFITIQDDLHKIQLHITKDILGEDLYEDFKTWDIGDIIGAYGKIFKTKTDELTVEAATIELISKSIRPLPEKFHGLTNQEQKYRQRYLDLIMNEVYPARNMAVPDPWFANTDAAFEEVYQLLDKATDNIIEKHEESSK